MELTIFKIREQEQAGTPSKNEDKSTMYINSTTNKLNQAATVKRGTNTGTTRSTVSILTLLKARIL